MNIKLDIYSHIIQQKKKRWTEDKKCQVKFIEDEKQYDEEEDKANDIADEHEVPQRPEEQKQEEEDKKADEQED